MVRKDIEATIAQHFEDKRSYVAPDRREVLYGKDWTARKYAVWCKSGGRCQSIYIPKCQEAIVDIHHKVKRSRLRDDRERNLEGLCRKCHSLKHPEKQLQWSGKQSG